MSVPTAILFPGQGSQEPGMGRDVAESSKDAMELWKKAERISGLPLRSIYWESNDAELMADTRNLQPALTVVNLNLWQIAVARHFASHAPCCAAGHSLGEYSALAAAQVLSPEATLEVVSLRGALMAEADPENQGAMAAVLKLDRATVTAIAQVASAESGEPLRVANFNTPSQFVLSGTKGAMEAAQAMVKEHKGRAMILPVSGAFHSPLMAEPAKKLEQALSRQTWHRPKFPIYSNVTAAAITDGESLRELASKQMISSVLWIDTVTNQWRDGARAWVEIGPKGALSRMIKPILDAIPIPDEVSVIALGNLEAVETMQL